MVPVLTVAKIETKSTDQNLHVLDPTDFDVFACLGYSLTQNMLPMKWYRRYYGTRTCNLCVLPVPVTYDYRTTRELLYG